MTKLNKYIKTKARDPGSESFTTSINIEKRQYNFIKENNINLSQLIRDMLNELIDENKGEVK